MRRVSGIGLAVALALLIGAACPAPAAAAKPVDEPGFISLFNGSDLSGWEGDEKYWSVQDGAITGQTTADSPVTQNHFLIWKEPVTDFELRVRFRLEGGNSGIYFRSERRETTGGRGESLVGPQADFSADGRWTGVIMEYTKRDLLAERGQKVVIHEDGTKEVVGSVGDPGELLEALDVSEWNEYAIIASRGHVILKINGVTMCELHDRDPRRTPTGLLALQVHTGPPMLVQFKDIWLKKL